MGWSSLDKEGKWLSEEKDGRPVQAGEEGKLLAIVQEDYGHRIVIDLVQGIIYIDPDNPLGYQNGTLEISNPKTTLFVCDDTNLVGEMAHIESTYELKRDEKGRKIHDSNGRLVQIRTDTLVPVTFRPIWFTRHISTLPAPLKIIGLQATLPELQGGHNYKRMIILYSDGRIGIA